MFLSKAMRYYRVWIYSCNCALFLGTFTFIIAFLCVFTDARMSLFPTIRLYHPSFLYCYMALLIQSGVLQAIGCIGAVKMNEKLLNIYWCVIIALLFGDGIIGIVWILRYNSVIANLRGDLKSRLSEEYGIDTQFQVLWDRIQSESHCCGIDGPYDYNMTQWMIKQSEHHNRRKHDFVPKSCCRMASDSLPYDEYLPINYHCVQSYDPELIYIYGCYDPIVKWFQRCANILSVLGFCVISFIKVCFVCILRYEIKEMIEKIKVLKGMEASPIVPVHDLEAYLPRPSMQQESTQTLLTNQTPQSNYRSACATERHHSHLHYHHAHCGYSTTTSAAASTRVTNGNNNELNISLSKKHSIV